MSIQSQVTKNALISPEFYKIGPLAEALRTPTGLVFIFAEWSGVATLGWKVLTSVLSELEKLPPIWVIDADEFGPEMAVQLLNDLPQGKGEAYWLKNGKIIAKQSSLGDADRSRILANLNSLED